MELTVNGMAGKSWNVPIPWGGGVKPCPRPKYSLFCMCFCSSIELICVFHQFFKKWKTFIVEPLYLCNLMWDRFEKGKLRNILTWKTYFELFFKFTLNLQNVCYTDILSIMSRVIAYNCLFITVMAILAKFKFFKYKLWWLFNFLN